MTITFLGSVTEKKDFEEDLDLSQFLQSYPSFGSSISCILKLYYQDIKEKKHNSCIPGAMCIYNLLSITTTTAMKKYTSATWGL